MREFEDMGIIDMARTLGEMGSNLKRDPLNDLSVKDYNATKIREKQDQLSGARKKLFTTIEDMAEIEKELIGLVLEQVNGYQLPKCSPFQAEER